MIVLVLGWLSAALVVLAWGIYLDATKEEDVIVQEELPRRSKEARLNRAIEDLVNLMPDYEGHQGKIAAALEQLRMIPR